jgi:uncharacterized protein
VNNHLKTLVRAACFAACLASIPCYAGELPAARGKAATTARSAPGSNDRASMEAMQIPSHGALMNALVYVAAGAGPHPAVILLHGFPGYERNLDPA